MVTTLSFMLDLTLFCMFFRASNPLLYMKIFTHEAWTVCLLLIILSSLAFLLLENVGMANFHGTNDSEEFTSSNSLALSLGMLIQKSYTIEMCKISSRILYLAISASTLILFAYYTCDMTSRLTEPSSHPIKSFDDVIKYGYKVFVYSENYADYLAELAPQVYEDLVKIKWGSVRSAVEVMLENPSHLLYHDNIEAVTMNEVVSLNIDETSLMNVAFAFQLNSEFTDLFNYHLRKMGEAGVIQRARYPFSLDIYCNCDSILIRST